MSEDAAGLPTHQKSLFDDRREDLVGWAVWVGVILALVGLVDGLIMASKKRVAICPDGTIFPEGTTDFDCYIHPQAGLGIAIASLSVVLGILVVLSGIVATAALRSRHAADTGWAHSP